MSPDLLVAFDRRMRRRDCGSVETAIVRRRWCGPTRTAGLAKRGPRAESRGCGVAPGGGRVQRDAASSRRRKRRWRSRARCGIRVWSSARQRQEHGALPTPHSPRANHADRPKTCWAASKVAIDTPSPRRFGVPPGRGQPVCADPKEAAMAPAASASGRAAVRSAPRRPHGARKTNQTKACWHIHHEATRDAALPELVGQKRPDALNPPAGESMLCLRTSRSEPRLDADFETRSGVAPWVMPAGLGARHDTRVLAPLKTSHAAAHLAGVPRPQKTARTTSSAPFTCVASTQWRACAGGIARRRARSDSAGRSRVRTRRARGVDRPSRVEHGPVSHERARRRICEKRRKNRCRIRTRAVGAKATSRPAWVPAAMRGPCATPTPVALASGGNEWPSRRMQRGQTLVSVTGCNKGVKY